MGARTMELAPGRTVLNRGDEVSGAYFVETGALRVYYVTPEGREGTLYWIEPGQSCILALNCTFARIPYPAWVEVDHGPTRVTVIPGGLYREMHETEPAVQKYTFEALSGRLFELMIRLEEARTLDIDGRLGLLLVRLADADGVVKVSQERLGQHLGTVREVVARSLRSLAAQGLIATQTGRIRVLNRQAMGGRGAG